MNKLLLGTMLMAQTISPYKSVIVQTNGIALTYDASDSWTITENQNGYSKVKFLKPNSYEDSIVKIETLEIVEFEQIIGEQQQNLNARLWTRITPKIELTQVNYSSYSYYNDINENAYNKITTTKQATLQFYRDYQDTNEKILRYNTLFNLTQYNATAQNEADSTIRTLANLLDIYNDTDAFTYYGSQEKELYDLNQPYILYEKLDADCEYPTWQDDFDNQIVWDKTTNFFYKTPDRVNVVYKWAVDPATNPSEYIDVGDLLLTILAMPMAWIGTAFNFTLWPGTAYAINIAHLISALVMAGVLIIIIKKVFK